MNLKKYAFTFSRILRQWLDHELGRSERITGHRKVSWEEKEKKVITVLEQMDSSISLYLQVGICLCPLMKGTNMTSSFPKVPLKVSDPLHGTVPLGCLYSFSLTAFNKILHTLLDMGLR